MPKKLYSSRVLFLGILAAGIILRLCKWNGYSLWFDEEFWLEIRQTNLLNSLRDVIFIPKPPLFRFLVCFFQNSLGNSEFLLRLLPFTLGVLCIWFIYRLGKVLFDKKSALIGAFLLAFSPFHIYYSQELTHYSLTCFLAILSVYYLVCALKKNKKKAWVKYVVSTALALYSNYLVIFLLFTENIYFLFSLPEYKLLKKKWLFSQLAVVLFYLPLLAVLPVTLHYLGRFDQTFTDWIPRGSLSGIFQLFRVFNAGYTAGPLTQAFAGLLIFPVFLAGLFYRPKPRSSEGRLLILWLFAPIIMAILFSKIHPTFSYRNFIFVLPAYYLLVAKGLQRFNKYLYIFIFSYTLVCGFSLFNYYRNIYPYPEEFYRPGVHAKVDNRGAAEYVIDNYREGDVVFHTCYSTLVPYFYYLTVFTHNKICDPQDYYAYFSPLFRGRQKDSLFFRPFGSCGSREGLKFNRYPSFLTEDMEDAKKNIAGYKRVWLFFSSWEPQQLIHDPSMGENQIKRWLDQNGRQLNHKHFSGIELYTYQVAD